MRSNYNGHGSSSILQQSIRKEYFCNSSKGKTINTNKISNNYKNTIDQGLKICLGYDFPTNHCYSYLRKNMKKLKIYKLN